MDELIPIGTVESPLTDRASAPKQGDEGAPDAWLVLRAGRGGGLDGIRPGDEMVVLTWLDRARRDVLRVHPRGDLGNPEQGVFNTRSPDRPNPIGLHVRRDRRDRRRRASACATSRRSTGRRCSTSSRCCGGIGER